MHAGLDIALWRSATRALAATLFVGMTAACHSSPSATATQSPAQSEQAMAEPGAPAATTPVTFAGGQGAGTPRTIPVPDAQLGMSQGYLPILAGWHGTAHIDRTSDPQGGGVATLATDLQSDDGTMSSQTLPGVYHTTSPQVGQAMHGFVPPGANLIAFRSTADLLRGAILPALHIAGQPSDPVPIFQDKRGEAFQKMASQGVPNPIFDAASVTIHGEDGRDAMVIATTVGGGRGTPMESTATHIAVIRAPAGKTMAVFEAGNRLPVMQPNPAWVEADQALNQQKIAQINQQGEQFRAQQNAQTQSIIAQGQANMANQRRQFDQHEAFMADQRQQFDQHNRDFVQHEQAVSDSGALFRGYIGDHDVAFRWCGPGGEQTTVNSTTSPGPGYTRC